MGGAAGEKECAPTFNALSDSEVRRDYMAKVCAYLPYDAVVFFVVGVVIFGEGGFIFVARHKSGQSYPFLNERAVKRNWKL